MILTPNTHSYQALQKRITVKLGTQRSLFSKHFLRNNTENMCRVRDPDP